MIAKPAVGTLLTERRVSTRRDWIRSTLIGVSGTVLLPRVDIPPGAAATPQSAGVTPYRYLHLDVFTDRPLTGNQLAVFLEPEGLAAEQMQDIARELNFSEVTFVFAPRQSGNLAWVRIFGRSREMQFAGHPVIGTAFALAEAGRITPGTDRVVFELGIGPSDITLEWDDDELAFAWMSQQRPEFGPTIDDLGALAEGLGVDVAAVRTDYPCQEVSCGNPFFFVPLATRADVDRVSIRRAEMQAVYEASGMRQRGVYAFSTEPGTDGGTVYSRMVGLSGFEDPATGSAAGPLGCYLVRHGVVPIADAHSIVSVQGVAMQRPSRIYIRIGTEAGEIVDVQVGGRSALVGEGTVRTAA